VVENAWAVPVARIVTGRASMGGIGIPKANLVMFAGGYDGYQDYDLVDVYDATANIWTESPLLSFARSGIVAVAVGNVAIFAGGYTTSPGKMVPNAVVDVYNVDTQTWNSNGGLSVSRYSIAATVIDNYLAIFAGGLPASNAVDMYDSNNGNWTTSTLSVARGAAAAASIGNLAFIVGGINGDDTTHIDAVEIYDGKLNKWNSKKYEDGFPQYNAGGVAIPGTNIAMFAGGSSTPQILSPEVTATVVTFECKAPCSLSKASTLEIFGSRKVMLAVVVVLQLWLSVF